MKELFDANILPALTYISEWTLLYISLKKRGHFFIHVLAHICIIFLYSLFFQLLIFLNVPIQLTSYFASAITVTGALLMFKEKFAKKNFIIFFFWSLTTFLSVVCNYIATWLAPSAYILLARFVTYSSVLTIFVFFYIRYLKKHMLNFLNAFTRPWYTVLPVLAFLLLVIMFNVNDEPGSLYDFFSIVVFEVFVIFSYYLTASTLLLVKKQAQSEKLLLEEERVLALEGKYYADLEQALKEQESLICSNWQHIHSILLLIENNDYANVQTKIATLLNSDTSKHIRQYCEHPVANAVIGSYVKVAEEKDILVAVELDIPIDIGIGEYELSSLFGNAIENAIEACNRINPDNPLYHNKHIIIKTRYNNPRFAIRIENTFQPTQSDVKNLFPSSKGRSGGLGLESIASIITQYQGTYDFQRIDNTFVLSAIMHTKPKPTDEILRLEQ